ncbi:MAG: hypothetical protein PHE09_14150 [Oscillospiraceae bacterium]|nr:hypothetical protein [Oscillospiraceae bacterium]
MAAQFQSWALAVCVSRKIWRVLAKHPEIEVMQIQANDYDCNTDGTVAISGSYEIYEIYCKYHKLVILMEPVIGEALATVAQRPEGR